ncbi:MAG: AAA family ATPase [Candidatus Dormibacteria bacterium]
MTGEPREVARDVLRTAGHARGTQPLLMLVCGPPGSGKSVVAQRIGDVSGTVTLHKDAFKEPLMTALGVHSVAESTALGAAAVLTLFAAAEAVLRRRTDLILECTFNRADGDRIGRLQRSHDAALLQVHVTAPIEVLEARWRERASLRHPGHLDSERLPEMRERVIAGTWDPMPLDGPLLRIDTSAGAAFDAARWMDDLRQAQAAAATR